MMPQRRAQRRDANEASLVADMRRLGMFWIPGSDYPVDGLVGWRGLWLPAEIKDPSKPLSKRAFTAREAEFPRDCQAYGLPFVLAHSIEDVVKAYPLCSPS